MKIIHSHNFQDLKGPFGVALGFFDGVHLGHQAVIKKAVGYAKGASIENLVITFDRSPKQVFRGLKREFLTPMTEKIKLLKELGVDNVLILPFDEKLIKTSAEEFIQNYLVALDVAFISVGFDFRFGVGGAGDVFALQRYTKNFHVSVLEKQVVDKMKISSTVLREYLAKGEADAVVKMLGRQYSISGTIGYGKQLGRTIGFATANIQPSDDYIIPASGVYATLIYVDGKIHVSMTNIGHNPTFNATQRLSIETHIFDFNTDIYEKEVRLEFVQRIRGEQKFANIDELVAKLKQDEVQTRKILALIKQIDPGRSEKV